MSDTINELKYLDDILSYLKTCPKNSSTLNKIFYNIYNEVFSEDGDTTAKIIIKGDSFRVDYTGSNNYKMNKLFAAINFLAKEELLLESTLNNEIQLSFAGIIKTTSTFVSEYKREEAERNLKLSLPKWQKVGIASAIIVGAFGIISAICSLNSKNKCSIKHIHCSYNSPNSINNK